MTHLGFIFIDMDETLGFFRNYDGSMNDEGFASGIYLRKNIKEVLKKLKKEFLLFITTAATVSYTRVVLEHTGLAKYFHGIYTRTDFVRLENEGDANQEASPGGYEKRYSLIMKHFGIKIEQANHGLIIGDNDYDTSCDVPELKTLIVDSLFVNADTIYSIIMDIFKKNPVDNYEDIGINLFKKSQKHPIANLETESFELECLDSFEQDDLEEVPVDLTEAEKEDMKVTPEEEKEIIEGKQALELEPESVENLGEVIISDSEDSEHIEEGKENTEENEPTTFPYTKDDKITNKVIEVENPSQITKKKKKKRFIFF